MKRQECGEAAVAAYDMGAGTRIRIVEGVEPHLILHLCIEGMVDGMHGGKAHTLDGRSHAMGMARPGLDLFARKRSRGLLLVFPLRALNSKWMEGKCRRPAPVVPSLEVIETGPEQGLTRKLLSNCLNAAFEQMDRGMPGEKLEPLISLLPALTLEILQESAKTLEETEGAALPWYVKAVERHIQENSASQICMRELAMLVGLSPRTLHEAFRKHRGYSPMRFLREQRLRQIHNELAEPTEQTRVTDVVLKWGVNHLGRFSAYYTQHFGEKPSDTLQQAKQRVGQGRLSSNTATAG